LIPSYNPGGKGLETVRAARAQWDPVWVIVDGSTDGSGEALAQLARADPHLRVLVRARNGGKGAALLDGLIEAQRAGFTHALAMDSDGQHPAQCIGAFMAGVRWQCAPRAPARPQDRQLVHESRDAVGRNPRHAVRLSCLPDRAAHRRDAQEPLDAAL
jgi:glycosyltransferase involved in cell wall biosynthesis